MKPKVVVLLSSYNGEKYIAEQIDGIFRQENVRVEIIVRDEDSVDGTRSTLKKCNGLPKFSKMYVL